ncbi:unnamed protein product [Ectocarpus sp. 6 AP-2014]
MPFSIRSIFTAIVLLGPTVGKAAECDCAVKTPESRPTSPPTSPPTETRTIVIKNVCSFDLDMGFTGGYAGPAPCAGNQEEDVDGGRCFWTLELSDFLKAGKEMSVVIEKNNDTENNVVWSGAMYAIQSPHADEACPDGCSASVGAAGTVTLSEFTMLASPTLTFYDISHVHGANIPTVFGPHSSKGKDAHDPYRNGVAGGDCSWAFEPPEEYRKYLIEVKNAHGTCLQDDECDVAQREVCGASLKGDTPVYGTCGELFGYLNAHTNCIAGSLGYPFYCEVYHDLYGCSGQYCESGYSESVTGGENVCGCSHYDDMGIPSSFPCVNTNPLWVDKAYQWIHYIKRGCTSAYEYAYSDSTSTFTSDQDTFELVFCPRDSEERFYYK